MDLTNSLKQLKKDPLFSKNVGMILIHNGIVRAWSRKDHRQVTSVRVKPDLTKIEELRREFEKRSGIYKVVIEASSGELFPGDDLLFIIVAGDVRENVKPALSELLDRVKAEAISKEEVVV